MFVYRIQPVVKPVVKPVDKNYCKRDPFLSEVDCLDSVFILSQMHSKLPHCLFPPSEPPSQSLLFLRAFLAWLEVAEYACRISTLTHSVCSCLGLQSFPLKQAGLWRSYQWLNSHTNKAPVVLQPDVPVTTLAMFTSHVTIQNTLWLVFCMDSWY